MTNPELSVFITTYNSELYIREAVSSILNQTYTDFELIIIDNCSTDNTVPIIKSFEDKRIQIVLHSENIGIAGSRNEALEMASGTFISFLDSDDIAHPQKFEKQITFLKANPDFGLVGSLVILINEKGIKTGRWKINNKADIIPSIMLFYNYFVTSAVMFRKELTADIRYPEELIIGEDYVFWFYLLQKAKGTNLPEYLTSYRQHPESIIQRTAAKKEAYEKKVYELIFKQIGLHPSDEEYAIHLSLKNNEPVTSISQLKKTLIWLNKISQNTNDSPFIDHKTIGKVILNRWLKVCYKSRRNPILIIYGLAKILLNPKLFFN